MRFGVAVGRYDQPAHHSCPFHGGGCGRLQGGGVDQEPGFRILELELQFRGSKPRVERDEDGTQESAGEERLHEGRVVLAQVGHPVPLGHSPVPERVGQPAGAVGEFLVAHGV